MSRTKDLPFSNNTLADCLMDNVTAYGQHVGYYFKGHAWTWNQMNIASDIAADEMYTQGIRPGDHVAIWAENSINWVIFLFAVSKLKAVSVLLNTNYKKEELVYALNTAKVKLLCYSSGCPAVAADAGLIPSVRDDKSVCTEMFFDIFSIDYTQRFREYAFLDFEYVQNKDPGRSSKTACILFTSGSTSAPKPVCLSNYNIVNNAQEVAVWADYTSEDRMCLCLPLFHCFGLVVCMLAALSARTVVCIPGDMRTSTVLQVINWYKCTILHTVPTYFLALINNRMFREFSTDQIRMAFIGGAPVTEGQLKIMQEAFGSTHFRNAYGMTETSPSIAVTDDNDTFEHISKSVGRKLDRYEVEVHSMDTNKSQPQGEVGEIVVRGYNVMKGYYEMPREKQGIDDERWLHTGDLGRFADDGFLYIVGRAKEIIIRGGENISPVEVENAIGNDPNVALVKVVGAPEPFLGEQVIACIELKPRNEYSEEALRTMLEGAIAKFKIPSYIFVYPKLPLTANLKVDAVALKKDAAARVAEITKQKEA